MSSGLYRTLLLLAVVVSVSGACRTESAPPILQQTLLTKEFETRYLANEKTRYSSSYPPIIAQAVPYYYVSQLERSYQYDLQSQLTMVKQANVDDPDGHIYSGNESNWYHYAGNKIIQYRFVETSPGDTLTVNKWGLAVSDQVLRNSNITYFYDGNGYLVRRQTPYETMLQTIEQGNVTKQVIQSGSQTSTTTYKYDLTRPALPDPLALFKEGKGSRNLLIHESVDNTYAPPIPFYARLGVVNTSYSYEFDERKRVKQQMIFKTDVDGSNRKILTVKNFVYSD